MPQISPTSRPAFAELWTQVPTSSSSGCAAIPSIAALPTFPVAHLSTRYFIRTSARQQRDEEARRELDLLDLDELAGGVSVRDRAGPEHDGGDSALGEDGRVGGKGCHPGCSADAGAGE